MCGEDWCRVKNLEGNELVEAKLKYRSKDTNEGFYLQVITLFEEFYVLMDEMHAARVGHEYCRRIEQVLDQVPTQRQDLRDDD
jgi:hypothetical protein